MAWLIVQVCRAAQQSNLPYYQLKTATTTKYYN